MTYETPHAVAEDEVCALDPLGALRRENELLWIDVAHTDRREAVHLAEIRRLDAELRWLVAP